MERQSGDGESGLYLIEDGNGDFISERPYAVSWSYEPSSRVVTVVFAVAPHEKPITMRLRYDPARDLLAVIDERGGDSDHVFKRAEQRYLDWWLAVKRKQAK